MFGGAQRCALSNVVGFDRLPFDQQRRRGLLMSSTSAGGVQPVAQKLLAP
jgi:hypothetical protein